MRLQFGDRNGFVRNLTRNGEPMRFTTENDLTADDCALGPRTIVFDFINMRRPGPRALPAGQARFEHVRYTGTSARDWAHLCHICTGTRLAPPHLHRDSARRCRTCTGTRLALVHREMSAPPPSALTYCAAVFRRISSPDAKVAGRTGMRWSVLVWPPEKAVLVLD